jgi:hypothetical protein
MVHRSKYRLQPADQAVDFSYVAVQQAASDHPPILLEHTMLNTAQFAATN